MDLTIQATAVPRLRDNLQLISIDTLPSRPPILQLDLPEERQIISKSVHASRYTQENQVPGERMPQCRKGLILRSQSTSHLQSHLNLRVHFPYLQSTWVHIIYNYNSIPTKYQNTNIRNSLEIS